MKPTNKTTVTKPQTVRATVLFPVEVYAELCALAIGNNRSMSNQVVTIVRQHLDDEKPTLNKEKNNGT